MTTVVLLVGLPGSGKSTLARQLCERRKNSVHIEYDQVSTSLLSQFDYDELEAWRRSRTVAVNELGKRLMESASLVVLDDNFHLRSMRKTIYRFCQRYVLKGYLLYFGVVFIDTPLELCLEQNVKRESSHRVDEDTIRKMSTCMEPPDSSKSAWDSNAIRVTRNSGDLTHINDWICAIESGPPLSPPRQPLELKVEGKAGIATIINVYDLMFRKWVAQVAKTNNCSALAANSARKKLLQDLRSGDEKASHVLVSEFCDAACSGWSIESIESLKVVLNRILGESRIKS